MSAKIIDLTGSRFGRWTVISFDRKGARRELYWHCKCECGVEKSVNAGSLRNDSSTSCGCLTVERMKKNITHGHSVGGKVTPEYEAWRHAKKRCFNKKDSRYSDYGGRGITMFIGWTGTNGFSNFYDYIGPRPGPEYSLDRYPNNDDGNYEPGNVRWGTDEQQRRNKRTNHWIEHDGKRMIMSDWATSLGMTPKLFWQRIKIYTMEELISKFKK